MGASELIVALTIAVSTLGQTDKSEVELQNELYKRRWGTDLVLKFDDLATRATVEAHRVPYSGYIYPDNAGGTVNAMYKYDRAFHRGRGLASGHERWDTASGAETISQSYSYGFFGRRTGVTYSRQIPYWHGHCNGWTAAAIRHPEPSRNVTINGVTFTPKDVKSLLAEMYIYSDIDYLAGEYGLVKPDMLHITMANWLGRERYPIAMEATPGKEKWNFPIYGYATTSAQRGENRVEVKMNIAYANYSNQELDQSPRLKLVKYFHYMLNLNSDGDIVGGYYFRDSNQIDLLWAPLPPIAGGQPGNDRGNPHLSIERIMDICRRSCEPELLTKWHNERQVTEADTVVAEADTEDASEEEATEADEPAEESTTTTATTAAGSEG